MTEMKPLTIQLKLRNSPQRIYNKTHTLNSINTLHLRMVLLRVRSLHRHIGNANMHRVLRTQLRPRGLATGLRTTDIHEEMRRHGAR